MADKKRLLIYAHYYIPDAASTGQILKELAEGMLDTFNITVICVVPSYTGKIEEKYKIQRFYQEEINGVKILRIRVPEFSKADKISRIRNIVSYYFGARKATRMLGDFDYILSLSQPPILGGLLGVYGKRKKNAKYAYQIQDMNPEQVIATKYSGNKVVIKLMMWLDKRSCRKSDIVITVGRDLVETIQKRFRGQIVPRTMMINNWIDEKEVYPLPVDHPQVVAFMQQYGLQDKFVIMYSGNIGLYYDLENLFKVIEHFKGAHTPDGREVAFAFVGGGAVLDNLVLYAQKHNMNNVKFIPYQDKDKLIYSLNAADVHWCVNAKGIKGVSCPSKAYGIWGVSKPILGVLESGSEIRMILEETRSGLVCEPGDYEQVERNIQWFIDNAGKKDVAEMAQRGHDNLLKNLTKYVSIQKYKRALTECETRALCERVKRESTDN